LTCACNSASELVFVWKNEFSQCHPPSLCGPVCVCFYVCHIVCIVFILLVCIYMYTQAYQAHSSMQTSKCKAKMSYAAPTECRKRERENVETVMWIVSRPNGSRYEGFVIFILLHRFLQLLKMPFNIVFGLDLKSLVQILRCSASTIGVCLSYINTGALIRAASLMTRI